MQPKLLGQADASCYLNLHPKQPENGKQEMYHLTDIRCFINLIKNYFENDV